ncbi:S8 family serine peptidase [Kribbella aluminosa]|uniref:S8 family serine peptidase n=1 Tax=Kribbella aluminosa TaxID=416017 RepID=UPI0031CDDE9C
MSRPALSVLLGTMLVAGLLSAADAAAASPQRAASASRSTADPGLPQVTAPTTVTLVTGDKITLTPDPDGTQVSMQPAVRPNGYRPVIRLSELNGHRVAVPEDAGPLIASGVLDQTLFDLNYLVANGYADNATKQLPLITQMTSAVPAAKVRHQADAVPGVTPTVQLDSLHATAADVPKSQAGAFWASITGGTAPTPGKAAARAFGQGIAKVWLDRKVKATLDQSVPMIGAPQAWAAGYTGKGVKVAVLDTGIDPNHPDLKGRVTESKNFTRDADITDGFGHGTHVASIITGSGAASGGRYKGVAPDVDLLVGKVLDHTGTGEESDVIAGMEWAAAQGAKVINLSLGGDPYGDESQDPGSLAVNRLTESTGALFVIAAGNNGQYGASTVGSPGVAKDALTVASVDKSDQLAYYSSRGPLLYPDRVSKPDIAGPGSDIVAARAAGTSMGSPVDDHYTSASGTSMATPHVAGAAAILAQEHPDWSGLQLKAALMSTSKDDHYSVFQQGAGRVDVARAVTQQVVGVTTGVDYGRILDTEQGDVVRPVTYRNDSASDVTLSLTGSLRTTTGTDTSAAVSVPGQVVVPAHGTATVDVTVHAAELAAGFSSGAVVATADGVQVRTAVALRKSRQTFPVQVTVKSSAPMYSGADVSAFDVEDSTVPRIDTYAAMSPDRMTASITLDLPPGRWWIRVGHDRLHPSQRAERVVFSEPDVTVAGPAQLNFDDRDAVPLSVTTDTPSHPISGGLTERRDSADGSNGLVLVENFTWFGDGDFLAAPNKPVTDGKYTVNLESTRGQPQLRLTVDSANGRGLALLPSYPFNAAGPHLDGTWKKLPLVDVGWSVEPEELAKVRGKLVLMSFTWGHGGTECVLSGDDVAKLKAAGAIGVLQESGSCELYPGRLETDALPVAGVDSTEGAKLRALLAKGRVTVTLVGVPDSPVVRHVSETLDNYPQSLALRVHDRDMARIRTSYTPEWQLGVYGGKEDVGQRRAADAAHTLFTWPNYLNKYPQTREELFGPITPGAQWIRSAGVDANLISVEERRTILRPGRMPDERWLGAPRSIGPSDVPPSATNLTHMGFCSACRDGDRLVVVPQYANPDPLVVPSFGVIGAQAKLYAGDREIPGTTYHGAFPAFTLPAAEGRYKLILDTDLTSAAMAGYDLYKYSAKVHSEWTFGSQHVGTPDTGNTTCYQAWAEPAAKLACAPQQLLYLRYSAPTDSTNKVGHGVVPLQLKPYYERTAKPQTATFKSVKVSASYDGGKSWRPVAGVSFGSAYQGLLLPPRGTKTVSLRVDAVDQNGNTVSQTIVDAFGVR